MKKKLMVALLLTALLAAPTASAAPFALSNPIDLLYSWVVSLWDTLDGVLDPPAGFEEPDDEEDPGLPGVAPSLDPHG